VLMNFNTYFEEEIDRFCERFDGKLDYLQKYLLIPGKQFRPQLYLDFIENFRPLQRSDFEIAVGIEFLHLFFLVHDDLMDGDELRRDHETIHFYYRKFFGELKANGVSIIVGDLLFCRALELMHKNFTSSGSSQVTFYVTGKTAHGQLQEYLLKPENMSEANESELITFYKEKTALYSVFLPMALGFYEGGVKLDFNIKDLEELSANLGVAFQLRDDLIEFTGEKKRNSNNLSADVMRGKITPMLLKILENADIDTKKRWFQEWTNSELSVQSHDEILAFGEKFQVVASTEAFIQIHLQKAFKLSKEMKIDHLPSLQNLFTLMKIQL